MKNIVEVNNMYSNQYRRKHSDELRKYFDISENGIDYHNPFNIGIEFKESFANNEKKIWFKLPKAQLELAHYIVFCIKGKEFYIQKSLIFLKEYSFETYHNRCNIRINTVRNKCVYISNNYLDLQWFVNNLK